LAASAEFTSSDDGVPTVTVSDFDGGDYSLHPFIDEDSVILPGTGAGYAVRIQGDPEVLGRLGKALLSVSRNSKGDDDES